MNEFEECEYCGEIISDRYQDDKCTSKPRHAKYRHCVICCNFGSVNLYYEPIHREEDEEDEEE